MMIDSTKNVPDMLLKSRDFQGLLRLSDILTGSKKCMIDNFVSLISPDECPSRYLPLLASYVGYEYDNTLPYDANRIIIKYYPLLIRNRGTIKGLKLAAAVAIAAADRQTTISSAMELLNVVYIKENGMSKVYIYYPNYISKINDLIEVVRPVGLGSLVIESISVSGKDEIEVRDTITKYMESYNNSTRSSVDSSNKLGHGEVGDNIGEEEDT